MSRRSPYRGRGPRLPTWALVALVVACLGVAVWLFLGGGSTDPVDDPAPNSEIEADRGDGNGVNSVLDVAGEDESSGQRRGEAGRGRIDRDADEGSGDDSRDARPLDPSLPATFVHLRNLAIAIAPASATAGSKAAAARRVKVGGLRLRCAGAGDPDRLRRELMFLTSLRDVLERAGADVTTILREDGSVDCVDERIEALEDAAVAVVVRAGSGDSARVFAARPAVDFTSGDRAASIRLAAEVSAALDLDSVTPGTTATDRSMLATSAAIDLNATGATTLVELAESTDEDVFEELAFQVARGIAAAASSARSPSGRNR